MRFTLIDRITEIQLGKTITAIKSLSLAEEYLRDHFPRFPVMPGVLMLEAMYQASAWLVRATEDFEHSMVELREARNVRYGDFVQPGQVLVINSEILKQDDETTSLKAQGTVNGNVAVSARLTLHRYHLAQRYSDHSSTDVLTRKRLREIFRLLYQPSPDPALQTAS